MSVIKSSRASRVRSADIVDHTALEKLDICLIGAGAIGSNAAYLLAKLGVGRITLFDDDYVNEENFEPQFFAASDRGMKVSEVASNVGKFVPDVQFALVPRRFTDDTAINSRVIISGVDSIASRKDIVRSLRAQMGHWDYYIDARMGGNIIELYFVTPDTLDEYWDVLIETEPLDIPCSARATAYNGMMIASMITRYIAALSKMQPVPSYMHIDLLAWGFNVGGLQQPPAVL